MLGYVYHCNPYRMIHERLFKLNGVTYIERSCRDCGEKEPARYATRQEEDRANAHAWRETHRRWLES